MWYLLLVMVALTGGPAFEALNNAAELQTNMIIVLNDNKMSISENVGGLSQHLPLCELRKHTRSSSPAYTIRWSVCLTENVWSSESERQRAV